MLIGWFKRSQGMSHGQLLRVHDWWINHNILRIHANFTKWGGREQNKEVFFRHLMSASVGYLCIIIVYSNFNVLDLDLRSHSSSDTWWTKKKRKRERECVCVYVYVLYYPIQCTPYRTDQKHSQLLANINRHLTYDTEYKRWRRSRLHKFQIGHSRSSHDFCVE